MKKTILILFLINALSLFGEGSQNNNTVKESDNTDILPIFFYNNISLEDQKLNRLGGGLAVLSESEKNELQIVLLYSHHSLKEEPLSDYPDSFDNVEFILQKKSGRHRFFTAYKSSSDQIITGGLNTFAALSGYGYEVVSSDNHSLYLGGSLAVSDWSEELPGNSSWPVIPLPFIHYDFTSELFSAAFDFTTSPMIDLVLAPENPLRLNASFIIGDLSTWDEGGVKIDSSLEYRFSDFAGIKAGFTADDYEYDISGDDNETFQLVWKTFYGTLDLSLLELTYGYAFDGKEFYSDDYSRDVGDGLFFNIQLVYLF